MSLLSEQLLLERNHKEGLNTTDLYPLIFDIQSLSGSGSGATGPTGPAGATGATGATGPTGPNFCTYYSFYSTQTGGNAPTFDKVGPNTTGATYTWNYSGAGVYLLEASSPIFSVQTTLLTYSQQGFIDPVGATWTDWIIASPTQIQVRTILSSTPSDDQLNSNFLLQIFPNV